jgi:hypothetical protein
MAELRLRKPCAGFAAAPTYVDKCGSMTDCEYSQYKAVSKGGTPGGSVDPCVTMERVDVNVPNQPVEYLPLKERQ